jgi:polyhydroxyalkanoate synthesis regulator phasin
MFFELQRNKVRRGSGIQDKESKSAYNDNQSRLDGLHDRIQSRLDESHADFKELAADLGEARQSGVRAQQDRIEGFKRALRDILQAADREWH